MKNSDLTPTIEQVRAISLSDAIRQLVAEACAEGFDWIGNLEAAWAERPFDRPGEGLFTAWIGDRLVGVAAITEDHYLRDGQTGRLRFVYVSPASRGCGVAEALTQRCRAQAGRRWGAIRLHTNNPVAAQLYAKHGFSGVPIADAEATHAKLVS